VILQIDEYNFEKITINNFKNAAAHFAGVGAGVNSSSKSDEK